MPHVVPYLLAALAIVLLLAAVRPGWGVLVAILALLLLPGRWWGWRTRHFRHGVKALRRGETEEARRELEAFLAEAEGDERFDRLQPWFNLRRRFPYVAAARSNLGIAALRSGDLAAATAAFERALEVAPRFVQALYGLGIARWREGRLTEAEEAALRALEVRGSYMPARVLLAAIRHERGDRAGFEEAVEGIQERGHDAEALIRRLEAEWGAGGTGDGGQPPGDGNGPREDGGP